MPPNLVHTILHKRQPDGLYRKQKVKAVREEGRGTERRNMAECPTQDSTDIAVTSLLFPLTQNWILQ